MVIDKSWTLLERHEKAFYTGHTKFVGDCKPLVNSVGNIKCPCKSCRTVLWVSIENLPKYITRYGWDPGYKTWVYHGEPNLPPPPPVIDNTRQPQMSDMIVANEELYPGCDYVTRLDFMVKFTYFKVKGKLTDSIFNEMLEFFQHVFPTMKGYKLPSSYYAIKKTFKTIGLGWKDSNTPGKKVPKKVLCYFSIIPILQRLYKSSHIAKEMTWHATGKCTEPDKMQHPVDGLQHVADDIDNINLLTWLCMKESSFMLTLLIPGPKSPGKDIDVYLRPLIDDLKVLWALKGVETIDVSTCQKFNMRAMVLWTINDFLPQSSFSGWSGQGYKACSTCNEDTPSSLEFNGEIEDGDPPRKFNRDQIQAQLARFPMRVKGKHLSYGGVKIKRNVLVELNWTKRSIFYELEYWSFLTLKHNLDIMHIEKNMLEAILNTLLMNEKSKDTAKARQDLKRLGIRSGLWLGQTKNEKCSKPQAAYSFTPENKKKFCQFIKGVKLHDGFGSNFKHKICSATLMEDDTLKAQSKVVDILCNLELIYPLAFFDIMINLVIHLPLEALEGEHIHPRWMFMFERFIKKLKGYARNKAKPEGSIAEGYVAEEALTFSSYNFQDVTTKFNRPDRNVDPPPPTCQFQVFRLLCKSIGLRSVIRFDAQELKKVIWYVLHNSPEIDTCRSQFKRHERRIPRLVLVVGVGTTSELFAGLWTNIDSNLSQLLRSQCCEVVEHVNPKKFLDEGVIVVDEDPDVIHFDNSFDLPLSTSLNDLDNATLHIDGQSTEVDASPDIIDLDEDDDIIDDEDALPHDLADSDDEDLQIWHGATAVTVAVMIVPLHTIYPLVVGVALLTGAKAPENPIAGKGTRQETRNLGLKKITNDKGPVPIRFEWDDKKTLMPLGDHASRWSNYLGELIKEMPLYYPSWQKVLAERKAAILTKIRKPSPSRSKSPNRAKSTVVCRQGSRSLARLRDQMMESLATREYPSLIHTLFVTHTVKEERGMRTELYTDSGGCEDDEMSSDEDGDADEEDEEDGDS
uniref:DUF4218 domain-containing protein n=1 Tax=Tanacetum cinerariifolium TaxID=118510 RepID=A0A6L2K586_TANCI|nr:hypothetical protein [Tanacetum cinerariifolium]